MRHRDLPANGLGPVAGGPSSITNRDRSMEAGFVESPAGAAVARLPSTPLIFASRNRTAAIWMCRGRRRLLASVIRRNATGGKSSITVVSANYDDGSNAPNPFDVRLANVRLNGRLLHTVPAYGDGSGQTRLEEPLYGCFSWVVQGGAQRAARQAVGPAVSPASAFHGRSAINPCGPTGAGRPSTNTRPTEMPMKQREP